MQRDEAPAVSIACPHPRSRRTRYGNENFRSCKQVSFTQRLHKRKTRVETMMLWLFLGDRKPAFPSGVRACVEHFHFTPLLLRRFSVFFPFYGAASEQTLPPATAAIWAGRAGCPMPASPGAAGSTPRPSACSRPTAKSKAAFLLLWSHCVSC